MNTQRLNNISVQLTEFNRHLHGSSPERIANYLHKNMPAAAISLIAAASLDDAAAPTDSFKYDVRAISSQTGTGNCRSFRLSHGRSQSAPQ